MIIMKNKINYLFGYIDEVNKEVSENSVLDFHLAHRTNPEFTFEPTKETPKLIWKYLSTSNLLYTIFKILKLLILIKYQQLKKPHMIKITQKEKLFEFYKRFQFSINQLLNTRRDYISLYHPIESRALVYQRLLLTD